MHKMVDCRTRGARAGGHLIAPLCIVTRNQSYATSHLTLSAKSFASESATVPSSAQEAHLQYKETIFPLRHDKPEASLRAVLTDKLIAQSWLLFGRDDISDVGVISNSRGTSE